MDSTGPFTFSGGAYPPDEYVVMITSSEYQSARVRDILEKSHSKYVVGGRIYLEIPFVIGRIVTAEEFGDAWPLVVERGVVGCHWGALGTSPTVGFRYRNTNYAISGASEEFIRAAPGWEDIVDIQRDDPNNPGHKVPVDPLLEIALRECDQSNALHVEDTWGGVGLLLAAYKHHLRAIIAAARQWVGEEILSASERIGEIDEIAMNTIARLRWFILLSLIVMSLTSSLVAVLLGKQEWDGLLLNLGTEMAGAVVTYFLFEVVIGLREKREAEWRVLLDRKKDSTVVF